MSQPVPLAAVPLMLRNVLHWIERLTGVGLGSAIAPLGDRSACERCGAQALTVRCVTCGRVSFQLHTESRPAAPGCPLERLSP